MQQIFVLGRGDIVPKVKEHRVHFNFYPSHNVPGDTTAKQRSDEALAEYKKRIAEV